MEFDRNNLALLVVKQYFPGVIAIVLVIFRFINFFYFLAGYILFCAFIRLTCGTHLYYTKGSKNIEKIIDACPSIKHSQYKPSFFISFSLFQLLFLKLSRVAPKYKTKVTRENIGSCGIAIDWVEYIGITPEKDKVLLLFPGLTGSVDDAYVMNIVNKGLLSKFNVGIYQMRILSENVKLPQDGSHMDLIADVDDAIEAVIKRFGKDVKISAIGYSYGANELVNYLAKYNTKTKKIKCGVSISCPYDFTISSKLCEFTIYDRLLVTLVKNAFVKTRKSFEKDKKLSIRGDIISTTVSGHEYDEYFSCPILGFDSPIDYYRKISCGRNLKFVDVPLLILHSKDDGITSSKVIPYDDVKTNKNITMIVTDRGAHSCFLEGSLFNLTQWINQVSIDFVNAANRVEEKEN